MSRSDRSMCVKILQVQICISFDIIDCTAVLYVIFVPCIYTNVYNTFTISLQFDINVV